MKKEKPLLNKEDFEGEAIIENIANAYSFDLKITWDHLEKVFDKLKLWIIKNNHLEELDVMLDHYNSFFKNARTPLDKINFSSYLRGTLDYLFHDKEWMTEKEYTAWMMMIC